MAKDNSFDTSPFVFQRNKCKIEFEIRDIRFTEKQKELLALIDDKKTKLIFVKGFAGTGKSYIAVYSALKSLLQKKTSDIIYIRPIVESSDSKLGYLPGTCEEKIFPYSQVLEDKLIELINTPDIKRLKDDNRIHVIPVNFARGLHWAAKFIILDEAQNFNTKELVTILTRIGEFCKVIICADPSQSDLNNGKADSFQKIYNLFNDEESRNNGIFCFEFEEQDIVRSELCRFIVCKINNRIEKMF